MPIVIAKVSIFKLKFREDWGVVLKSTCAYPTEKTIKVQGAYMIDDKLCKSQFYHVMHIRQMEYKGQKKFIMQMWF